MNDPLVLVATSFAAIIAVGTLLVAVNDWIESRLEVAEVAGRREGRRIDSTSFGRKRKPAPRGALLLGRTNPNRKQQDLLVDWF